MGSSIIIQAYAIARILRTQKSNTYIKKLGGRDFLPRAPTNEESVYCPCASLHVRKAVCRYSTRSRNAWIAKGQSPLFDLFFQSRNIGIAFQAILEIFEFLALLGLHFQSDLAAPVQKQRNLRELILAAATRGHRGCSDADTTW